MSLQVFVSSPDFVTSILGIQPEGKMLFCPMLRGIKLPMPCCWQQEVRDTILSRDVGSFLAQASYTVLAGSVYFPSISYWGSTESSESTLPESESSRRISESPEGHRPGWNKAGCRGSALNCGTVLRQTGAEGAENRVTKEIQDPERPRVTTAEEIHLRRVFVGRLWKMKALQKNQGRTDQMLGAMADVLTSVAMPNQQWGGEVDLPSSEEEKGPVQGQWEPEGLEWEQQPTTTENPERRERTASFGI
ncbi:hypothetical protein F7725_000682 [Dissostichus mawsoni]|uniref:Uncharacterized protein n=1 Tax=Dissostichus mawsoni TaxID=36200 RepID=A0A7J5ZIE0_DISMA|nr:hypothetical protein F7725_000682 [Dissostichus mawsoni]